MNATASSLTSGPQLDTRRIAAAAIDVALLSPLVVALYVLAGDVTPAFVALAAGWVLFYFFAFESGDGQTPGKRITGLRVLRGDGGRADMGTIAVRTALRVVDFAVGLLVMSATGQRRARVGDLAAGTVVVDARAGTSVNLATAAPAVAEPEVAGPEVAEPELAEPEVAEAPVLEDAPAEAPAEPEEPHRVVAFGESAWAPVSTPFALDTPGQGEPEVAEPEPEPVAFAEPEPDPTDPELWMAAQRDDAAEGPAEPAGEPDVPQAPAPDAHLLVHPGEEEERPFI